MARVEQAERRPGDHTEAHRGRGRDRFVGGPQPVTVTDHDDAATRDHAGERHDTRSGRSHDRARHGGEVHAAMSASERRGRRCEVARDPGRAVERPAERPGGRPRGARRGGECRRPDRGGEDAEHDGDGEDPETGRGRGHALDRAAGHGRRGDLTADLWTGIGTVDDHHGAVRGPRRGAGTTDRYGDHRAVRRPPRGTGTTERLDVLRRRSPAASRRRGEVEPEGAGTGSVREK